MALKKSEIYGTLAKCTNKLRSNSGIGAESFKNYVLILLFIKYVSDRKKSGGETILEIPDGCTFDDIVELKGKRDIGEEINKIIGKIIEANELHDVINLTDHDFCDKKLGNAEESSRLISGLVSAFQDDGLDFSRNRAADDDLIGDAYEYLMRNFASQAGKDKGQFYTPTEVSRLMALILGVDGDKRKGLSAYDPTCGSGSLLLRVNALANGGMALYGQDIDPSNIELSYLNMVIHGCDTADIRVGDTLNAPKHARDGALMTFDYVVSNPKFSLHNWMNGALEDDLYGRWSPAIGVPPQQYGDFAFLMHCVRSLKPGGKCAIILPNGVLTRGGDEARLRQWLVEQRLLSGVISFPANAFFGTTIAGNVLVIDNARVQDGVMFIDGSGLGYKDADSKIRLREQDIKRITDVWRKRADEPHFAHLARFAAEKREGEERAMHEIERNGFALNLSLYVTPEDKEVRQNIEAHLRGGIPEEDVERLGKCWEACPTLKETLFAPLMKGYCRLKPEKGEIAAAIEADESYRRQVKAFGETFEKWREAVEPKMLSAGEGCDPKALIAEWGQMLLDDFAGSASLAGAYGTYDRFMGYCAETLHDDLYIISNGGWNPQLEKPAKRTVKWTDLKCDLLPVETVVKVLLAGRKAELDKAEAALADELTQMAELVEENEEDFDEDLFYGKLSIANAKKRLKDKTQPATERQIELWKEWLEDAESEKAAKEWLKMASESLLSGILTAYGAMTEKLARKMVVGKWLEEIRERVEQELESARHGISAEVAALAERYDAIVENAEQDFREDSPVGRRKQKKLAKALKAAGVAEEKVDTVMKIAKYNTEF